MPTTQYPTADNYSTTSVGLPAGADSARVRHTPINSPYLARRKQQEESAAVRETPRGKRERIARYYSKVLSMCLSALYDGKPKRFPGRDYIEYVISALGYDSPDDWAYITDEDLIKANTVALRIRDDAFIPREIDRIQKQRERTNAMQAEAGNPIIIEFEAEYDSESKVNRAKYKRPICELVRDVIDECPVGSRDDRLQAAVKRHAIQYLRRFDGDARTVKRKRAHSPDSNAKRAATFAYDAWQEQKDKSGELDAGTLIRNAFKSKFGPELYGQIFTENDVFSQNPLLQTKTLNPETCTTIVPCPDTPKTDGLCCDKNIKPAPQSGENLGAKPGGKAASLAVKTPPVIVGESAEDFIFATFPNSTGALKPATDRQRELISRAGAVVPTARDEASALIGELIAAGAFSTFLSLEELQSYDAHGGRGPGKERRYCCPLCGKTVTDEHRDLTVDVRTGEYFCHCCGAAGVLREYQGVSGSGRVFIPSAPRKSEPEQKSQKWRNWFADAKPIAGTAGADYLEGRGVPVEAATAAGVKFGPWWRRGNDGAVQFPAVQFPVYDADGNLVAVIARAIEGNVKRTGGDVKLGVFRATLEATNANQIAITESPIDGLILAAVGLDAIATGGTHWPEWLPPALQDKDVAIATDADSAGDECASRLSSLLPTAWRLRPVGCKDWGEVAQLAGLDAVAEEIMTAMERAPQIVGYL